MSRQQPQITLTPMLGNALDAEVINALVELARKHAYSVRISGVPREDCTPVSRQYIGDFHGVPVFADDNLTTGDKT